MYQNKSNRWLCTKSVRGEYQILICLNRTTQMAEIKVKPTEAHDHQVPRVQLNCSEYVIEELVQLHFYVWKTQL